MKDYKYHMEKQNRYAVLVPMTIPCTGKSTAFTITAKLFQELKVKVSILSSDVIRARLMQKQIKKGKSKEQAFQSTGKAASSEFFEQMQEQLNKLITSKQHGLLILDKNNPPNVLDKTLKITQQVQKKRKVKIRVIGLLPKSQPYQSKGKFYYGFGLQYLACCLIKGFGRKEHENLSGDDCKMCRVLLGFFKFFNKFRFEQHTLKKYFDAQVFIKFQQEIAWSPECKTLLERVLAQTKGFDDHPEHEDLINKLKECEMKLPSVQQIGKDLFEQMKNQFVN